MSGRLLIAGMISVLCHGVLLVYLDRPAVPSVRLPTLEVVLTGSAEARPATAKAPSQQPTPAPASPPVPNRGARQNVAAGTAGRTAGSLPRGAAPPAAAGPAQTITALVPDFSRQLTPPAPLPQRSSTPAAPAQAPDRSGVVLAIRQRLAQFQAYPPTARRRGLEGAATVRFVIGRNGQLVTKTLVQSSGSTHLDQAALKLISDAAPYPSLPASVAGERLEVRIPIDYRLNQPAT
ncbi:MAG: TonB family protein [Pseudomonadota bacterium]